MLIFVPSNFFRVTEIHQVQQIKHLSNVVEQREIQKYTEYCLAERALWFCFGSQSGSKD